MKAIFKIVILFIMMLCIVGCTIRYERSFISTRNNIDWDRISEFEISNQQIEGKGTRHIAIPFSNGSRLWDYNVAVEDALQKVPGSVALVNATFTEYPYPSLIGFLGIYRKMRYTVKGNVVIDPRYSTETVAR